MGPVANDGIVPAYNRTTTSRLEDRMPLLTCALTLATLAGCDLDRATASQVLVTDRAAAVVHPESVSVRTLCGARVVIENHNDATVAVSYALSPTGSQTQVTLKARLPGLASRDEYIVLSASSGTFHVQIGTISKQVNFPQASCPSRPVVPATPPEGVETSTMKAGRAYWAPDSSRGNRLISLRRFWVGFRDGTAVNVRQALFDRLGATVLAGTGVGSMGEGDYLIEMQLPLDSGTVARDRVWNLLLSCSAVTRVGPDGDLPIVPAGVAPRDGADRRKWLPSAMVHAESVSVVNLCGPRMSIRNAHDDSTVVQYAPTGDGPRTTITLKKRPAGTPFSETYIIMSETAGKLVVWVGTRRTDTLYPSSTCPSRPVVPATPPLTLPSTSGTTFLTASDTNYGGVMFSDRRIFVTLRPHASQQVRQALFDAARVKVVGGIPSRGEGIYIVELDQPVTGTIGPVLATVDFLVRNAAVLRALPDDDGGFVRPVGVSPRKTAVSHQRRAVPTGGARRASLSVLMPGIG